MYFVRRVRLLKLFSMKSFISRKPRRRDYASNQLETLKSERDGTEDNLHPQADMRRMGGETVIMSI